MLQVSPVCRTVGKFRVHGHPGLNRVRFDNRVRGEQLGPGTYRISARTRGTGTVLRVTLVVVDARAPSKTEIAFARRSNVCGSAGVLGVSSTRGSLAAASAVARGEAPSTIVRHQRASAEPRNTPNSSDANPIRPVASEPISTAVENATNPIVIALLGLAVMTLGLAALPRAAVPDPRVMALVASHRVELAVAGTSALAAAVIAMLLV